MERSLPRRAACAGQGCGKTMPFQAAPFVMGTAGVAALGAGAWHVAMGNSSEGWASCAGSRKGYSLVSERSVGEIAQNLYHPGQGNGNVVGEDNHTGMSPRLSHVVETMAGTQKIGDGPPNWRALRRQEAENRQPFRAQSISLGEGLRSAFAHENRGPTAAQADAIRREKEAYERSVEERQRRLAQEQERRADLLIRDRMERQRRAAQELEAKRRAGESWVPNVDAEGSQQHPMPTGTSQAVYSAQGGLPQSRPHAVRTSQTVHVPGPYVPPPQGMGFPAAQPPERRSASAVPRQWEVLGSKSNYSTGPTSGIFVTMQPAGQASSQQVAMSPEPSAMMVPQQSHNVEERLFAQPPSFTPKWQSVPAPAPEAGARSEQPPALQPPVPTPPTSGQSAQGAPVATSAPAEPQRPAPPAGIGISFVPDQDGNLLIAHLVPGGPAMMSGQMYIGDRLLAVRIMQRIPL